MQMPGPTITCCVLLLACGAPAFGVDAFAYRAEAIPASVRDAFKTGESGPHLLAAADLFIWSALPH